MTRTIFPSHVRRGARRVLTLAALITGLSPLAARAQRRADPVLHVGALVRVRTLGLPERRTATVKDAAADSVALAYGRGMGDVRLAWSDVSQLEVFRGRNSASQGFRRGARRGLVTGLVLGAALTTVTLASCSGNRECFGVDNLALLGVPVAVGGATTVGALIGAAFPGSRWERVDVSRR